MDGVRAQWSHQHTPAEVHQNLSREQGGLDPRSTRTMEAARIFDLRFEDAAHTAPSYQWRCPAIEAGQDHMIALREAFDADGPTRSRFPTDRATDEMACSTARVHTPR
jgi:hypothetical protein